MLFHRSKSSKKSCSAKSCASKGAWIVKKAQEMSKLCIFWCWGVKNTQNQFLITWKCMSIILLMHEQTLNDPRLNTTCLLHKYWMQHKDKQKKAPKCSYLVSMNMIFFKYIFSINGDGGKREWNRNFYAQSWPLPSPPFTYVYQKFPWIFPLWNSSDHDVTSIAFELNHFKLRHFKLVPSYYNYWWSS
jgi:hypothetical protein